jgi:hypothetical protein
VNYLVRSFLFEGDRWSIDFTVYDDAAAQSPLFSGRNSGQFIVDSNPEGQESLAQFLFASRSLTADSQAIAEALTASGCGDGPWAVGTSQDITSKGCRAFRVYPRGECDREYDRVLRDGDRLFLGARPNDGNLCTPDRRPSRVSDDPLIRQR